MSGLRFPIGGHLIVEIALQSGDSLNGPSQ